MALLTGCAALSIAATAAAKPCFSVKVIGTGKPVILIPGLTCTGEVWDATVEQLMSKYRCYVLTLPGFGDQPPITGPYLQHVRDDIIAYVKGEHLDHPALIGHSLGGFMVLYLGSTDPSLFGPLISVDGLPFLPAMFNPAATVESSRGMADGMAQAMLASSPSNFQAGIKSALESEITSPKNVELMYEECKDSNQADAAEAMKEIMLVDLRNDVARIKQPLLLLGAGQWEPNDEKALTKAYEAQIIKIPHARLIIDPKSRHFIMLDDPGFFSKTVKEFLARNLG